MKLTEKQKAFVEDLLSRMTPEEKIGQMNQESPSIVGGFDVPFEELTGKITDLLNNVIPKLMYDKAMANRVNKTYICKSIDEMNAALNEKGDGFIRAMWCGSEECEDKIKEQTGVGSRCIPFEQKNISDVCVCCGKPAQKMVYWGKAY